MAKIFIDANIFIDLVEKRSQLNTDDLDGHDLFISPLSVHILMYVTKKKIPYPSLSDIVNRFLLIDFDSDIVSKAILNPTNDFEDNVQLYSAAEANCDLFLTSDAKLLKMKFFGKTEIKSEL